MSMFNLATSYLTTSSLPWFLDLTFQDPVECYSFQHWILLSPEGTATTDRNFRFGSAASFFLDLLVIALCSSPVSYWVHSNLGGSSSGSWYHTFSNFSFCLWDSPGKNTEVGWHFLFQLTMFCQNSSLWPACLWWPCTACLIAHWVMQAPWLLYSYNSCSWRTRCNSVLDLFF